MIELGGVGTDADLSQLPTMNWASASVPDSASAPTFKANKPAYFQPGAWLKSASAATPYDIP